MRGGPVQYGFRRPGGSGKAVIGLVIAAGAAFVLQMVAPAITRDFALHPEQVRSQLKIYQLVTYIFLHGGFFHLFINLYMLYIFGSELERLWGQGKFLFYFFFSGIGAGIITTLLSNYPVVGASGALYGVLLAYGLTYPDRRLLVMFLFPMKAKYAVILFGALEFFASLSGSQSGIAHITHLGGLVFGGLLLAIWRLWGGRKDKKKNIYFEHLYGGADSPANVDRILDKVLREGADSLTPDEKEILIRAGKFYDRKNNPPR